MHSWNIRTFKAALKHYLEAERLLEKTHAERSVQLATISAVFLNTIQPDMASKWFRKDLQSYLSSLFCLKTLRFNNSHIITRMSIYERNNFYNVKFEMAKWLHWFETDFKIFTCYDIITILIWLNSSILTSMSSKSLLPQTMTTKYPRKLKPGPRIWRRNDQQNTRWNFEMMICEGVRKVCVFNTLEVFDDLIFPLIFWL